MRRSPVDVKTVFMRVTTSEGWSTERDLTVPQPGRTLQSARPRALPPRDV